MPEPHVRIGEAVTMLAFLDYKYPGALEIEDPAMFERLLDAVRAVTDFLEASDGR